MSSQNTVPTNTGRIFNVDEVTGKEHSALETTAAEAELNAPNRVEAMHVSDNAERAKDAASQAAAVAKTLGSDITGESTTAAGQFKADASRTTGAAVAEGKRDVEEAKAVGAEYMEQVKSLASSAIETAQNYLPAGFGGKPTDSIAAATSKEAPSLVDTVKDTAANLYATAVATAEPQVNRLSGTAQSVTEAAQPHIESAKGTAPSAAETAQPHIESAKGTAQSAVEAARPHIERAKAAAQPHLESAKQSAQAAVDAVQPYVGEAKAAVQSTVGVGANAVEGPALVGQKINESEGGMRAPLESGPHSMESPYPKTTSKPAAPEIAASKESPVPSRN